ncbi:MAG: hypothetical protein MK554_03925 [Planctomycetes bacterium]|nr:hypothetical protein [Planctomycetota bacterium]
MRRIYFFGFLCFFPQAGGDFVQGQERPAPFSFTRLTAHWADYSAEDYLKHLGEVKTEVAQVGFWGAHFWSLAATPHGKGYPAHFPVEGHRECSQWLENLNRGIHKLGIKPIGHFNVMFLVGDPETPEGPRGFFKFYNDQWDEAELGPKPVKDPTDLLERNRDGSLISNKGYSIGGMKEYWGCLRNPHWRAVLKAWVRFAIRRGVDGFVINYYYRHDCHCSHCVSGFKSHLSGRYGKEDLSKLFGIADLGKHTFDEIGAWHSPKSSTLLQREALRFSQVSNKQAFDEVFVRFGRGLKPDLLLAQWNHIGDFSQIDGDEKCMLPGELWSSDEDYLWYSLGGSANFTRLKDGFLGEGTLQARYIRGASGDKTYTLGKYESVRTRVSIAELAANGGASMGFYTRLKDPEARKVITSYYGFLHQYDNLYRDNTSHAEALLLFPRGAVHAGNLAPRDRFRKLGRKLLDEHVLFDILPDDMASAEARKKYSLIVDPNDKSVSPETLTKALPRERSRFDAPATVRVSASRPALLDELTVHFVNYNRTERGDGGNPGGTIKDEKPIAVKEFGAKVRLPGGFTVSRVEFLTPEADKPVALQHKISSGSLSIRIPSFSAYGVARIRLQKKGPPKLRPKIAAIVTEYRHNSHADIIVSRLLQTYTLDGNGRTSPLELVSLYTDQVPGTDTSRSLAKTHGFRLSPTIEDALTLGTGKLAVDGVLLIGEHGKYPRSPTGNVQYPKRRFWDETVAVFRTSERVVPVFVDKHLSDNWKDALHLYDSAAELKIPIMAGSSLPTTWRRPAADVRRGAKLKEIVAITYGSTDAYGFHALEFCQALAEQRRGGETGIRAVQMLTGKAVWEAFEKKLFDVELFDQAWERLIMKQAPRDKLAERVPAPLLFRLEYVDGLRVNLLELNGAAAEWSGAWRYADDSTQSSLFWTQEGRPGMHFTWLLNGIEEMILTGKPAWTAERTLLTSGALDALLISRKEGQRLVKTPYLERQYQPGWSWKEPPFPPPMRPWSEQ